MVESEVVATSPYPVKSRVPVCCGFDSIEKGCSRLDSNQQPHGFVVRYANSITPREHEIGVRGRIRTPTGSALNAVPLLLGYADNRKRWPELELHQQRADLQSAALLLELSGLKRVRVEGAAPSTCGM